MALLTENYSLDELREHIRSVLSGGVWRLEGMGKDQTNTIDQGISAALMAYSRRCPLPGWEIIQTSANNNSYTLTDPGYGPWRVDPIEPVPIVAPLVTNLLGVTPITNFQGDGIAQFLNWKKTFRRVVSCDLLWQWDEDNQKLYISNSAYAMKCCVYVFRPRPFEKISLVHRDFIRRFALAQCRSILAESRRKFGDLPGPGGTTIKLNGEKLADEATAELKTLNEELEGFQPRALPVID